MERQERFSNIELLRIIAMIMIVASHFSEHGNFNCPMNTITINRLWIQFLGGGVNWELIFLSLFQGIF